MEMMGLGNLDIKSAAEALGLPAERGKSPDFVAVVVGGDAFTPPLSPLPLPSQLVPLFIAEELAPLFMLEFVAKFEEDKERTERPRPLARPELPPLAPPPLPRPEDLLPRSRWSCLRIRVESRCVGRSS